MNPLKTPDPANKLNITITLSHFVMTMLLTFCWPELLPAEPAADLIRAEIYQDDIDPSDFWISEKLDGVRAYWDGKQLWFRSGHAIHPPPWFTQGFPKTALDGELWRGRGQFESLSRTVRKSGPTDEEWHTVRYMLFELPDAQGTFTQRIEMLKALVARTQVPWLQVIEQFRISDRKSLKDKLSRIIAAGGEGLMLHRAEASYHSGRSNDLLKFKPYLDREASVIAHIPGKGRNARRLGSLLVEDDEGRRFRLGTGFTDEQRNHPPARHRECHHL